MVNKQIHSSGSPWEPIVGYCRAVRVGNTIEVSGTVAIDEKGEIVGRGNVGEQTRFILKKIGVALEALGATYEDVVRTRMYVMDITHWEVIGKAHGEVFHSILPATSMVQVSALISPELLLEIEVTAIVNHP